MKAWEILDVRGDEAAARLLKEPPAIDASGEKPALSESDRKLSREEFLEAVKEWKANNPFERVEDVIAGSERA